MRDDMQQQQHLPPCLTEPASLTADAVLQQPSDEGVGHVKVSFLWKKLARFIPRLLAGRKLHRGAAEVGTLAHPHAGEGQGPGTGGPDQALAPGDEQGVQSVRGSNEGRRKREDFRRRAAICHFFQVRQRLKTRWRERVGAETLRQSRLERKYRCRNCGSFDVRD